MMRESDETLASILDNIIGDKVEELARANDLLIRSQESTAKYSLDGTVGGEMEDEERAALTTAYFDAVETALGDKAPEEVRGISSSAVPAELTDRTTTVRGSRSVYKIYSGRDFRSLGFQCTCRSAIKKCVENSPTTLRVIICHN